MKYILFIFCFLWSTVTFADDTSSLASKYISKYKNLAVSEMHRTGIPASIKLAQGLLESDWGRSDLARKANNHFGIKCGNTWRGATFYKKDDDRNSKGKIIESCFRSFDSAMASYVAHSEFLSDPRKQKRYGFLFQYKSDDYKSWAKGLLKSGYATDPSYSSKLITIIEKYDLYLFDIDDANIGSEEIAAVVKKDRNQTKENTSRIKSDKKAKYYSSDLRYKVTQYNRVPMVIAKGDETLAELSHSIGISVNDLIVYNEIYDEASDKLEKGARIYTKKKKRSYSGKTETHKVKDGETMASIAQLYGIRLRSLYAKNRMPRGSKTIKGEKLALRKTVPIRKRPKFINPLRDRESENSLLFENDDTVK